MSDIGKPDIRGPLEFGNLDQIQAIKNAEKEQSLCQRCTGEGMIECPDCLGSGEIRPRQRTNKGERENE